MLKMFCLVTLFTLALATAAPAAEGERTHEGKVVKVAVNKLTMTDKDGEKEHAHTVPATAQVTCDGKNCKLDDLKAGYKVKVTMKGKEVSRIEAQSK